MRVLVPPLEGSPLELRELAAAETVVGEDDADSLLYVISGAGTLELDGREHVLSAGAAALVLAGERARVTGDARLLQATVSAAADRHAPLGPREVVTAPDAVEP